MCNAWRYAAAVTGWIIFFGGGMAVGAGGEQGGDLVQSFVACTRQNVGFNPSVGVVIFVLHDKVLPYHLSLMPRLFS